MIDVPPTDRTAKNAAKAGGPAPRRHGSPATQSTHVHAASAAAPAKRIVVSSDLSERVPYNDPELPVYASFDSLSSFADFRCPCHWHRDLEFVHVKDGEMRYFINGEVVTLRRGDGLVVNSSRLHYGFSPEHRQCWFTCVVVGTQLFDHLTTATTARCEHAFGQDMADYVLLSSGVGWQRDVMQAIDDAVTVASAAHAERASRSSGPAGGEAGRVDALALTATAIRLCDMVLDRFSPVSGNGPSADGAGAAVPAKDGRPSDVQSQRDRLAVLAMTGLIQRDFPRPLSLDDIASAGGMGRSRCCHLFRRFVGRTPNEYLIDRRLEEAKRMLDGTGMGVAEVARDCGFSSASYFISVFRRRFGMTPKEYRNQPTPAASI
ncbi:AraC family transcriptional regulator [Bifidobacterium leontopitheci]|nr:helix-turn-helix domain-containing protein [Bifidobacterium leontopitheci]